jgi:hypothetical protein
MKKSGVGAHLGGREEDGGPPVHGSPAAGARRPVEEGRGQGWVPRLPHQKN